MIIEPLGDFAFIVRDLAGPSYAIAEALADLGDERIVDVNASYETIGVYSSPGALTIDALQTLLDGARPILGREQRAHKIPVLYDGEDLARVAKQLRITEAEVMSEHSACQYTCYAVGFCPGFPYLGWLPPILQGIPRMQTPRTRTELGSVGITGKQTAVYPLARPGGWPIIGRTPLTLVDMDDHYFPIRAGDLISFCPISDGEFQKLKGERL